PDLGGRRLELERAGALDDLAQFGQDRGAFRALAQMRLTRLGLGRVQLAVHVRGEPVRPAIAHRVPPQRPMFRRSIIRARWSWALDVPVEIASRVAISSCL